MSRFIERLYTAVRGGVLTRYDIARLAQADILCLYGRCPREPCVVPVLLDITGDVFHRGVAMTVDRHLEYTLLWCAVLRLHQVTVVAENVDHDIITVSDDRDSDCEVIEEVRGPGGTDVAPPAEVSI